MQSYPQQFIVFYMHDALLDLNDNTDALGSPLPEDKARADLQGYCHAHKPSQLMRNSRGFQFSCICKHAKLPGRLAPGETPASAGSGTARTPLDATIAC